jgi:hypothetical protein
VLELVRGKARREADGSIVVALPSSFAFDPINPQPGFAEIRGPAGMDALVRWAAGQLGAGPSIELVVAKRAATDYDAL